MNGGPYVGLEDITSWTGELSAAFLADASTEDSSIGNAFEPGDVLFGKLRPYLAKVWVAQFSGKSTTECLVMKPEGIEPRFLGYVCLDRTFINAVDAATFGSKMPRAEWDFIGNLAIPVPERTEQLAIADYLGRKTARLDVLVATKECVLKLLTEKRQALVARAVTRGIDLNVHYRDSGIPWLGSIPAHWDMGSLKHFGALIAGAGFPHEFQGIAGEALPFYKVGDLAASKDDRYMEWPPNTISFETAAMLRARVIPKNSIVYAKIGAALLLNRRRVVTQPCLVDNNMTAYSPNVETLSSEWAFYWSSILDFGMLANPGAVPSLSEGVQAQLPILVPPIAEQRAITDHLDRETARLDMLTKEIGNTITLLKERRSALIEAAITGRTDIERAA